MSKVWNNTPKLADFPSLWKHLLSALVVAWANLLVLPSLLAVPPAGTGVSALTKRLERPFEAHWTATPLEQVQKSLQQAMGVSLLVDRRMDPSALVDFNAKLQPASTLLDRLAESKGASAVPLETVVYIGPLPTAAVLPATFKQAKAELRSLPPRLQSALKSVPRQDWQRLAEPRQLLLKAAQNAHLEWDNLETFPHDLWREGHLPEAHLAEQLTLLLAGFDATFRVLPNGKLHWVPLEISPTTAEQADKAPPRAAPEAADPASPVARPPERKQQRFLIERTQATRLLKALRHDFPNAKFKLVKGKLEVEADSEELKQIAERVAPVIFTPEPPPGMLRNLPGDMPRGPRVAEEDTQISLKTQDQTRESLLRDLAKKLEAELEITEAARTSGAEALQEAITLELKNETLTDALKQILHPAGLQHEFHRKTLRILPLETAEEAQPD